MKKIKITKQQISNALRILELLLMFLLVIMVFDLGTKIVDAFEPADLDQIEEAQKIVDEYPDEIETETDFMDQDAYYPITDEEIELVKAICRGECRGCDCEFCECFQAVAECIRNRAIDREQTISEVCFAKNQFCDPYYTKLDEHREEWLDVAIEAVFFWGDQMYEEPIMHFHADYVTPYWADDFKELARFDGTVWYS